MSPNCAIVLYFVNFLLLVAGRATKSNSTASQWLIGGQVANTGQFPYQVSLQRNGAHICGGSIINDRWIVTAANCIVNKSIEGLEVLTGTNKLDVGGVRYSVIASNVNPKFDEKNLSHDVALIQTETRIAFNSLVQPIELGSFFIESELDCTAVGWGQTEQGDVSNDLLYIETRTMKNEECLGMATDDSLCTWVDFYSSICHGDAGGPLVLNNLLIGIASWSSTWMGKECNPSRPNGFMRVSVYRAWILENTI